MNAANNENTRPDKAAEGTSRPTERAGKSKTMQGGQAKADKAGQAKDGKAGQAKAFGKPKKAGFVNPLKKAWFKATSPDLSGDLEASITTQVRVFRIFMRILMVLMFLLLVCCIIVAGDVLATLANIHCSLIEMNGDDPTAIRSIQSIDNNTVVTTFGDRVNVDSFVYGFSSDKGSDGLGLLVGSTAVLPWTWGLLWLSVGRFLVFPVALWVFMGIWVFVPFSGKLAVWHRKRFQVLWWVFTVMVLIFAGITLLPML